MTTRETIESYFAALRANDAWEDHLADGIMFISHTSPIKKVTGRDAYLESTKGFYGMIDTFEVGDVMIEGDRACALTRYQLQPPVGDPFPCDVAEVFNVKDGRIDSLSIYFDTAPFPN